MAVGLQTDCVAYPVTVPAIDWTRPGRAHLVGIGGSGMRSLARVLAGRGWGLSGSDLAVGGLEESLPRGTRLFAGHRSIGMSPRVDVLVRSDAIGDGNPELLAARAAGTPVLSYFDVVARLMQGTRGLCVAGTHGKSTTTAMAAWVLAHAGLDPTVLCGAATAGQPDGGRAGHGPIVLAEACEYRANFLKLPARHAVITGIEHDHFDCYPTLADMERAFGRFAQGMPADGLLVVNGDCPTTRRAIAGVGCRVETFGIIDRATQVSSDQYDWSAKVVDENGGRCRFDLAYRHRVLCRIDSPMVGRHNVLNLLAAAALCRHEGVRAEGIADAMRRFPGVRRRLETLGDWRGVRIIEDFAHHPTALSATLTAVHRMHPDRRVCVVFQPHQASRTARLLDELAESLHNGLRPAGRRHGADRLWVAEIFRAREGAATPGEVTSAELSERVRRLGGDVGDVHSLEEIGRELREELHSGDVLLVIGAGDVRRVLGSVLSRSSGTAGQAGSGTPTVND